MHRRPLRAQLLGLAAFLALAFVTGGLGAFASANASAFYAQLAKPAWVPPAWVFGPVWTVLYIMIGLAAWLAWRETRDHRRALGLWGAQLVANALWSWFFFAWKLGAWAFADVVLMLVLIVSTMAAFWRIKPAAAVLLAPYLGWVGFATALTWAIWQRNPTLS